MKRSSFLKRLLGLAATTVAAPAAVQALIKEVETPQVEPAFKYKGRGMVQLTGRVPYPSHGNILIDRQGRYYYVTGCDAVNVWISSLETGDKAVIHVNEVIEKGNYTVLCSAIPEGSKI